MRREVFVAAALGVALNACSGARTECVFGAECASGACSAEGTCAPAVSTPGAEAEAPRGAPDAGPASAPDASSAADAAARPDGGCFASRDGVIDGDEIPIGAGARANYLVASNVPLPATAGTAGGGDAQAWDLSAALPGDHPVILSADATSGTWYGAKFPQATFAARLRASQNVLALMRKTSAGLLLGGLASPEDGSTRTEVTYATEVPLLAFPLRRDAAWETTSTVTGVVGGATSYYQEAYRSKVTGSGTLKTPYGTFDVLRVLTVLTRSVGFVQTVTRTYSFVAECVGTVATIYSKDNEASDTFTTAAEVQRLTP